MCEYLQVVLRKFHFFYNSKIHKPQTRDIYHFCIFPPNSFISVYFPINHAIVQMQLEKVCKFFRELQMFGLSLLLQVVCLLNFVFHFLTNHCKEIRLCCIFLEGTLHKLKSFNSYPYKKYTTGVCKKTLISTNFLIFRNFSYFLTNVFDVRRVSTSFFHYIEFSWFSPR